WARPASHRRRKPIVKSGPSERGGRLPRRRWITLRLLGQLRAGYHLRGLRPVHVAPLHAVWRQDRADRIAIVVDHQNRVVARDRGDELFVAARRGKRAGEPATVLLVDDGGERDAVEPRLGRRGRGMMRIARPEDDRLALAFPGAAKVRDQRPVAPPRAQPSTLRARRSRQISTWLSSPPGANRFSLPGTVPTPRSA